MSHFLQSPGAASVGVRRFIMLHLAANNDTLGLSSDEGRSKQAACSCQSVALADATNVAAHVLKRLKSFQILDASSVVWLSQTVVEQVFDAPIHVVLLCSCLPTQVLSQTHTRCHSHHNSKR